MKLRIREMAVFAMLGTLMYVSKVIMEMLPNIHLVGILTVVYTIVYRKKHSNRAVKKTLTIPEWLNEAAMTMELNFSQILQEALILKLQK